MIVDGVEERIAARLRQRREELGISLAELAKRSSVSKAMIGKIENGVCCPTAGLLGRLCSGLGVTLSTLMLSVEDAGLEFYPAANQPTWRDPDTKLSRTVLSPPSRDSSVQIARLWLPGGATVDYPVTPARAIRQHLVMLSGRLEFTIGDRLTTMTAGDCLFALIDRPTRLHVPGPSPAEYLVVQESA
jgi:transcriptional regulator with XRE-family HTH domain